MEKQTEKLTAEQSALVARHLPLIGWCMRRRPELVAEIGRDEAWSIGCLALSKAVARFDAARGTLTTYAVHYILGYWRSEISGGSLSRHKRLRLVDATLDGGREYLEVRAGHVEPRHSYAEAMPAERLESIHRALGRLSPRQRKVLQLRYFHGLSFRQIGRKLGISWGLAQYHATQGCRMLRELLGPDAEVWLEEIE